MENNSRTPQQQLDDLARARASTADRLVTPDWYHVVLGLVMGVYLAALEVKDGRWAAIASAIFVLAMVGLAEIFQRRNGIRMTGLRSAAAWSWALLLGAALVTAMIAVKVVGTFDLGGPEWVATVVGASVLLAAASTWISRRAEAAMLAELRGTQ